MAGLELVLGVWGAALSTALGAFKVRDHLRDRPQRISCDMGGAGSGSRLGSCALGGRLEPGAQGTTVVEAGFKVHAPQDLVDAVTEEGLQGHSPVVIVSPHVPAGAVRRFCREFPEMPIPAHADFLSPPT